MTISNNYSEFVDGLNQLPKLFSDKRLAWEEFVKHLDMLLECLTYYADCIRAASSPLKALVKTLQDRISKETLSQEQAGDIWHIYREVVLACQYPYIQISCKDGQLRAPSPRFRYCLPWSVKAREVVKSSNFSETDTLTINLPGHIALFHTATQFSVEGIILSSSICYACKDQEFARDLVKALFQEICTQPNPPFHLLFQFLASPLRGYLRIESYLMVADQALQWKLPKLLNECLTHICKTLLESNATWSLDMLYNFLPYHVMQYHAPLNMQLTQHLICYLQDNPERGEEMIKRMPEPRHIAVTGRGTCLADSLSALKNIKPFSITFFSCFLVLGKDHFLRLQEFSDLKTCAFYNTSFVSRDLTLLPKITTLFIEQCILTRYFARNIPLTIENLYLHKTEADLSKHYWYAKQCDTIKLLSLQDFPCEDGIFEGNLKKTFRALQQLFLDGLPVIDDLKQHLPETLCFLSLVGCSRITPGFLTSLDRSLPNLTKLDLRNTEIIPELIQKKFPMEIIGSGWLYKNDTMHVL